MIPTLKSQDHLFCICFFTGAVNITSINATRGDNTEINVTLTCKHMFASPPNLTLIIDDGVTADSENLTQSFPCDETIHSFNLPLYNTESTSVNYSTMWQSKSDTCRTDYKSLEIQCKLATIITVSTLYH